MMRMLLPDLEFQHTSTWRHQQMKWRASRAAAKVLSNTCRGRGRYWTLHDQIHREKLSGWKLTCYLNMEQSCQSGPHCGAQVTQQAVGEGDDFLRTLSPTPAPLIHKPERIYMGLSPNLLTHFFFLFFLQKHWWIQTLLTGRMRAAGRAQRESRGRRRRKVCLRPETDRWRRNLRRIPPNRRELWRDFLRPVLDHPFWTCLHGVLLGPARVQTGQEIRRGRVGEEHISDISLQAGVELIHTLIKIKHV